MIAVVHFARERDPFSIRRPARLIVRFVVIGNLREFAGAVSVNDPNVGVAVLFVLFAGAIGNKSDSLAVGRPLRIAVVPIIAFGNLFAFAALHIDNPQARAPVIKPTSVVELIRRVLVMTNVAAIFWISRPTVTPIIGRPNTTDDDHSRSIRRPANQAHAILEIGDSLR